MRVKLSKPLCVKQNSQSLPVFFFTHPNDNKYGGSPDRVGPGFLLEVKTRVAGSDGPLMAITYYIYFIIYLFCH